MSEHFSNPVFLTFGFLTVTGVVSVVAYYWHKVSVLTVEADLKRDMLNRGMSADEIERVAQASAGDSTRPASRSVTSDRRE